MRSITLAVGAYSLGAFSACAQSDGNPHNWDRQRRCDHVDYSPPCGVCEGFGGIPFGDDNADIHLTTCEPVANNASAAAPVKPVWGTTFTVEHYNEVLIGPKVDPFCFNTAPSNSSVGKLCYRADSGTQTYDAVTAKALRYDLNVKTEVGNITTMVLHRGTNMWIVNHLPWYAAGVHQCICTKVNQGGDASTAQMYPVQYNWTAQMFHVGTERIGIEYMEAGHAEVLEHWAFGPHHVWSVAATGEIRRMYQPFNGLQVFPKGTTNTTIDPTLFTDHPPALCVKKGGAAIRITCDDDGFPTNGNSSGSSSSSSSSVAASASAGQLLQPDAAAATAADVARAREKVPRAPFRGESFRHMSATLNRWLEKGRHTAGRTRPCAEWSAAQLQQLQGMLYLARDASLDEIYQGAADNRRLRKGLADLVHTWDELGALVEGHPTHAAPLHAVLRDGHCHEAVMWFVHHLSEDMKLVLREKSDLVIPLLSHGAHGAACADGAKALGGDETAARVCAAYKEQVTCASCHADVTPPGHDFLKQRF